MSRGVHRRWTLFSFAAIPLSSPFCPRTLQVNIRIIRYRLKLLNDNIPSEKGKEEERASRKHSKQGGGAGGGGDSGASGKIMIHFDPARKTIGKHENKLT